jgi:oxazoline/thiazoline synthase
VVDLLLNVPQARQALRRPAFRAGLAAAWVDPDQVFLLNETNRYVLRGRAYRVLAPLLDGSRTMADVVEEAGRAIDLPTAMYALEQLIRRGYVVDAEGDDSPGTVRAWVDALGVAAPLAAARRAGTAVLVEGIAGNDATHASAEDVLRSALQSAGLRVAVPAAEGAAVRVVLTEDYLLPELAQVDARQRAAGEPWMLAKLVGSVIWMGPVFVPGESACWHCLAARVRGNRQVERYAARMTGGSELPVTAIAVSPSSLQAGAGALALMVERWVLTGSVPAPLHGTIRTLDLASHEWASHAVTRLPQCDACGDPLVDEARPVLRSITKVRGAEGGYRSQRPESTLERLQQHVSPLTGVVSSLVRKEPADNTHTFSYAAGHDFVHEGRDLGALRGNLRFRSGGKGRTDVQARVSAICEAVERWSGVWRGSEPRLRGSAAELQGRVIPLQDILLFSGTQYAGRREWNRTCSPTHYHVVPNPLDPGLAIDWVKVWPLRGGEARLVPAAYAYHGHPDAAHFFCASDANGTAAGNCLEEAVLQALLELVERDAVALWWYNRLRRPAVDLAQVPDPWVHEMQDRHRALGRELWCLDLTTDLGIPVFAAVSRKVDGGSEDLITSFGAHLDPAIALNRAITEVNQFLPAVAPRNPDGSTRYAYDDPDALRWWSTATIETEPYLLPATGAEAVSISAFGGLPSGEDLRDDVEFCLDRLHAAGLDCWMLDQTRRDVDLSVVRVIVPGLRHFWRRLGPGRLYDVPVRLGWLEEQPAEEEMNPNSMFF